MESPGSSLIPPPSGGSVFDRHEPPSERLINECVHCGFCLPTCPTYALWNEEMDSPRGRIYLMKLGLEGKVEMTDKFAGHFDKCLGCMACMTACPSGVQYDKLIETTRAQLERNYRRTWADRTYRELVFWIFPHPLRLRLALLPLWLYERTGMQGLLRRLGLLRLLPARLQSMEAQLPDVTGAALWPRMPSRISSVGTGRKRVGLLLGCVQRVFFHDVNVATASVLAAEGCDVIIPREQGCCGALMTHAGRLEEARAAARHIIDTFERADVDAIVINAAGCGSNMKEYGYLLRDDPAYARRAEALAAQCRDISEVLAELEPRAPRHSVPLRVAYHDSCHLQHAQRIRLQPREILGRIPGLEVVEIPESAICCGSAGIYSLVQPTAASDLGRRKADNVISVDPDALVTSNPGCLLQISSGLRDAGRAIPTMHLVEVLDASIRGLMPRGVGARRHSSEDELVPAA